MKRRVIAAVWITGATVPLLLATVFLVGCCVLPFHQIAHKLMPICDIAANLIRGDHSGQREHDAVPPSPAREKQEAVKRIAPKVPTVFRFSGAAEEARLSAPSSSTRYRSFISLGAVRCDQDVGLHVLVETFLV